MSRPFAIGGGEEQIPGAESAERPDSREGLARGALDPAATRRILDSVAPAVLRQVRSILGGDHPDVPDVVQETLLGLLASLPSFRGECSVVHFACRIAVRTAIANRRRAKVARLRVEAIGARGEWDEGAPTRPDDEAIASRRRELLRDLLAELPEPQAESLALRVVLGLSMEEVSDVTGAPLNTVRSRLRLAKEALARRLASDPVLAEALEVIE